MKGNEMEELQMKYSEKCVPFIDGLFTIPASNADKPHLIGSKCTSCGKIEFPKRGICIECMRDDSIEDILLSRKGKIYAFTIMRWQKLAPKGHETPYAFGFVDLPEDVRILTKIDADDLEKLKTGIEGELELVKIDQEEGKEIFAFKFKADV